MHYSHRKYYFSLPFLVFLLFSFVDVRAQESYRIFEENGKYGLTDFDGKVLLKAEYDWINLSNINNIFVISKDHKCALVGNSGQLIREFRYEYISCYSEDGLFPVTLWGRSGFIDTLGKEVIPPVYDQAWGFDKGICGVKQNKLWGAIDRTGKVIIPIEYEEFEICGNWSDSLTGVKRGGNWGFIDRNNRVRIPFIYREVGVFSEGRALASVAYDRWGYIDANNKVVVPFGYGNPHECDYESADFKNGIAKVRMEATVSLEGYINKENKLVIPLKYNCIGPFKCGYADVTFGKEFGYVDTAGNEYLHREYDKNYQEWGEVKMHPAVLPDYSSSLSHYDDKNKQKWTLEQLLNQSLVAFRQEPANWPALDNLKQICISLGMFIGGTGNYTWDFMEKRNEWNVFKEKTIYKIISSEKLRKAAVDWALPYYKKSFQTMHPFHQKAYKEIAAYLKNYINQYDKEKTLEFLKRDEWNFVRKNYKGEIDPCRKMSAFVDRLILIHKVISVEDAKKWINKIADEVEAW